MVRRPIERSNQNYYHVMARSNNREFFYLPQSETWKIFSLKLAQLQDRFQIKISAFVLMSNHFHLLLLTPSLGIDKIMYFLMKDITLEIQKHTGRINKIFGGRYKGSLIKHDTYLTNVYKYIYLNPVKSGLVSRAELYPFSTLYYKTNRQAELPYSVENIFPIHPFCENLDELKWINLRFDEAEYASIKTGLRKSEFAYAKDNSTGKKIIPGDRHLKKLNNSAGLF